MRRLIIWHDDKKGVYYHRLINGSYIEQNYAVGSFNSYGHKIVHIVDNFDFYKKRVPLKKKIINKSIHFLKNFDGGK